MSGTRIALLFLVLAVAARHIHRRHLGPTQALPGADADDLQEDRAPDGTSLEHYAG